MELNNAIIDVVLLAAGQSRRMGSVRKQYQDIGGLSVYQRAINSFRSHAAIARIALVVPEDDLQEMQETHRDDELIIVAGGTERHHSVACGLAALGASTAPFIAIHDAARPIIPPHIIDHSLSALHAGAKAVIPALPVADTIKQIHDHDDPLGKTLVSHTLDRSGLRRIQTPQIFDANTIIKLHQTLDATTTPTDDASLAEAAGIAVQVIDGDERLAKLTWQSDLQAMRARMTTTDFRTGTGFDVHRFKQGDGPIMICGLSVPHDKALDAHSDGDVGIHALCDAIFGALCDGDIGMHFPPSDDRWKDASSDQFLTYAVKKIAEAGARLVHVDVTILCERPKIGVHRAKMQAVLADLCNLPTSAVSVKATTTEQLGFTGREEGIAAQAAATIAIPSIISS